MNANVLHARTALLAAVAMYMPCHEAVAEPARAALDKAMDNLSEAVAIACGDGSPHAEPDLYRVSPREAAAPAPAAEVPADPNAPPALPPGVEGDTPVPTAAMPDEPEPKRSPRARK